MSAMQSVAYSHSSNAVLGKRIKVNFTEWVHNHTYTCSVTVYRVHSKASSVTNHLTKVCIVDIPVCACDTLVSIFIPVYMIPEWLAVP